MLTFSGLSKAYGGRTLFADAKAQLRHRALGDVESQLAPAGDIVYGPVSRMITVYAADNDFDLIVMGTRGRGALAHLMMGSIAESVIRTAHCPVLVVRGQTPARLPATACAAAYAPAV